MLTHYVVLYMFLYNFFTYQWAQKATSQILMVLMKCLCKFVIIFDTETLFLNKSKNRNDQGLKNVTVQEKTYCYCTNSHIKTIGPVNLHVFVAVRL